MRLVLSRKGFDSACGELALTAPGARRSEWQLPAWFAPGDRRSPLTYHGRPARWRPAGDHVRLATVG